MKNFGIRGPEECAYIGGNAKMSEFQAAMGICNLRHISEEIEKRREVAERYRMLLSDIPGIRLNVCQSGVEPNYAYFPVVFEGNKFKRDEICERLAKQNIIARKYFYPLTNDFECYKNYSTAGGDKTPIARYISKHVLTLPLYADLGRDAVDRICKIILN